MQVWIRVYAIIISASPWNNLSQEINPELLEVNEQRFCEEVAGGWRTLHNEEIHVATLHKILFR